MTVEKLIDFIKSWEDTSDAIAAVGRNTCRTDLAQGNSLLAKSEGIDAVLDDLRKLVKPLPEAPVGCEWVEVTGEPLQLPADVLVFDSLVERVNYALDIPLLQGQITHVARPVREGGG